MRNESGTTSLEFFRPVTSGLDDVPAILASIATKALASRSGIESLLPEDPTLFLDKARANEPQRHNLVGQSRLIPKNRFRLPVLQVIYTGGGNKKSSFHSISSKFTGLRPTVPAEKGRRQSQLRAAIADLPYQLGQIAREFDQPDAETAEAYLGNFLIGPSPHSDMEELSMVVTDGKRFATEAQLILNVLREANGVKDLVNATYPNVFTVPVALVSPDTSIDERHVLLEAANHWINGHSSRKIGLGPISDPVVR